MARQKKQDPKPQAAPSKKSAKKSTKKAASKPAKTAKPATPAKATKKAAKAEPAKSKRVAHAKISDETILKAFDGGSPLAKRDLVAACGGDGVAVTAAVNRLRGLGKIVVQGSTRNALYSKAA